MNDENKIQMLENFKNVKHTIKNGSLVLSSAFIQILNLEEGIRRISRTKNVEITSTQIRAGLLGGGLPMLNEWFHFDHYVFYEQKLLSCNKILLIVARENRTIAEIKLYPSGPLSIKELADLIWRHVEIISTNERYYFHSGINLKYVSFTPARITFDKLLIVNIFI